MRKITLEQIFTDPKYREMSETELRNIIGYKISYDDYSKLFGNSALDKARRLIEKWKKP